MAGFSSDRENIRFNIGKNSNYFPCFRFRNQVKVATVEGIAAVPWSAPVILV